MTRALFALLATLACGPLGGQDRATAPAETDRGAAPAPAATESSGSAHATQVSSAVLDRYDFEKRTRHFDLPGRLDEISGLAMTSDGRLFAHDDERGRIYRIDPATGEVGASFDLGSTAVPGDFEGIALIGERFFLVTSLGFLYEFREGSDGASIGYRVTDSGVGAGCEVEGLDYDPVDDALLLACKTASREPGVIVIHRLPVDPARDRPAPLRVQKQDLSSHGLDPEFDPSAIAVDAGGTILLLSGRHEALVEIDRSGAVVAARALSRRRHPQPEGLAIAADGTLYIADEANGGDAQLTVYGRGDAEAPG
jgi:uncharacterized protein YjiK